MYSLDVGSDQDWIIQQAAEQGIPLPDKIANRPTLGIGLEMYMDAFNRLSTCRQLGMGVGPIPWTAIGLYAVQAELDTDHTDKLYYYIEAMDAAFLKWSADRNKPNVGKN